MDDTILGFLKGVSNIMAKKVRRNKPVDFAIVGITPISITPVISTPTITPVVDPSIDIDTTSKSVLAETIEAYKEISDAFKALGNSFNSFGSTIKTQGEGLGNQLKSSVSNINLKISDFMLKFKNMGTNLANNLKL